MAGHYPLNRNLELKVFTRLEFLKKELLKRLSDLKEGQKTNISNLTVIKLPSDFTENPQSEIAFSIGKFTLQEDFGVDNWLAEDCFLECHFEISKNRKNIKLIKVFWVI